jgi:nucleotide-binding universal stress UspA family protein
MDHEALRVRLPGLDASVICSPEQPEDLLIRVAKGSRADTIVVSDDRVGFWYDHILGSVTRRVLRASHVPVVVVAREDRLAS